jgi:chromosome partitioning protein
MPVIVMAARKGGVGKTTLAAHLGVAAAQKGRKVALIDTDPQGSLRLWWNRRPGEDLQFANADLSSLAATLEDLKSYTVFIDTPPAISPAVASILSMATLVVIPCGPSELDLTSIAATVEITPGPMVFLINQAAHRARLTIDIVTELSAHGAVCPTIIHRRTKVASVMSTGSTVLDAEPRGKSAEEMTKVWSFIERHLAKARRGRS